MRRSLNAPLKLAGLPHDLRHRAASFMAAEGVPVWVAMELLGHTQVSTTMNVLPTWLRS